MNTKTSEELRDILSAHTKWLRGDVEGVCAVLRDADLSGAVLRDADLSGADLRGANLRGADLSRANLRGADLSRADLSGANLSGANLRYANLSGAVLNGADLRDAVLRDADLSGADLSGADLSRADLSGADLSGANLSDAVLPPLSIVPSEGAFIAWKKVYWEGTVEGDSGYFEYVLKMQVLDDAKRVNSTGRKCRASKVQVLAAFERVGGAEVTDGRTFRSSYDFRFTYRVGEVAQVSNFSDDFREECAPGIHFFLTRAEAEAY